jgi:hypothetical protein
LISSACAFAFAADYYIVATAFAVLTCTIGVLAFIVKEFW